MKNKLIGIDIGGTNIKIGILTKDGKIIHKTLIPTYSIVRDAYMRPLHPPEKPQDIVKRLCDAVKNLCYKNKIKLSEIVKIGIGCPGPLNSKKGIIYSTPNLFGWENFPLKKCIERHLKIPTVVNNDANSATYGEYWLGAGKGYSTVVCFTLGTGIGGGIILNGKLFNGIDDSAGHFGHTTIVPDGPKCGCGNKGCLEALASAPNMVKRAISGIKNGAKTKLIILASGNLKNITAKMIHIAATKGDKFAKGLLAETGRYLGIAVANVLNILNPEIVIFSGGMIEAGDLLFKHIRKEAMKRALPQPAKRVKIVPAKLGNNAGIIGAAGLALVGDNI